MAMPNLDLELAVEGSHMRDTKGPRAKGVTDCQLLTKMHYIHVFVDQNPNWRNSFGRGPIVS